MHVRSRFMTSVAFFFSAVFWSAAWITIDRSCQDGTRPSLSRPRPWIVCIIWPISRCARAMTCLTTCVSSADVWWLYPTRRIWRMQTESSSVASLSCFGWSWAEVTWIFSSIWSIPSVVAYLRGACTNGAMSCGTHVRQRSLLLRQRCFEVTARFYHAICSCGSIIGWKSQRTCCWMQRSACEDSVLN